MKETNRVFICSKQRNKKETRKPFIVFSSDHPVIYASSRSNFSQDDDALSPVWSAVIHKTNRGACPRSKRGQCLV